MDSVKVALVKFKLIGEMALKVGDKLEFEAVNREGKTVKLSDYKGKKVISVFPDINTTVCDKQTQMIGKMANQHKEISFISISMNEVDVINKWCLAQGMDNIVILSDKEHKDFGNKSNLIIKKLDKLARGLIALDENNVIERISFKEQITEMPDFTILNGF